ncbi:MAG: hypothetical protein ACXABY_06825 [Candidatus Thorarchaeota archaeon]|jgi:hypothetical protein
MKLIPYVGGWCDECSATTESAWLIELQEGYYKFYLCEGHLAALSLTIGKVLVDTKSTSETKA